MPTDAPRVHRLKTWPGSFSEILRGKRTFEIRFNDRDFQEGDILWFEEWDPGTGQYRDSRIRRVVSCVHDQPEVLRPGFVVLGLGSGEHPLVR